MRFRPRKSCARLAMCATLVLLAAARADDGASPLRTEFGEVHLQKLAIGKTHSVRRLAETALVIRNTGGTPLDVQIEIVVPSHHELRPGAEPLPERQWVRLEPSSFHLPARSSATADVRVTLPYEPDLAGKTYQVDLWSGTVDSKGRRARVQVDRLLFTVAMDYRDDTEAQFSSRAPGR